MLSTPLRILLVAGALLAILVVGRQIKRERLLVEDAIFWMILALVLFVLALFPDIAVWFAGMLGFMSPANLVFLVLIALLLWKTFTSAAEISLLKNKINEVAHQIALDRKAREESDEK